MSEELEECSDKDVEIDYNISQLCEATKKVDWHARLDDVLKSFQPDSEQGS